MKYKVYFLWTLCMFAKYIYAQPVENLYFNVERGFYDAPLLVNIQADEPSAVIRYTLDGSEPTPASGFIFSGSIVFNTSTFIRAIAYTPTDTTEVVTHSYIYLNEVLNAATNPQLTASLLDIPSISIVTNHAIDDGNPVKTSVEFLYPDGKNNHQVNTGIRYTNGGAANGYAKKTMRLYFKSEFGPSTLKYDLFEDAPYGEYSTDKFDKINLRYGSQDNIAGWWQIDPTVFLRNRWGYDTQLAMGWSSAHGKYMHVYINGVYNGMYHIHELPDESFQEAYRGGEKEEYDVIKNSVVVEGNNAAWNIAFNRFSTGDYAGFTEYVDIENYIDYHLISWYQGNADWGQNNWYMARRRASGEKFQFFLWDMDNSMMADTLDPNLTVSVGSFNISMLIKKPDFVIAMRDRIYKHFFGDGALTPQKAAERFELRADEIRKGTIAETAQWGGSQADWLNNVDWYLNDYFPNRTDFVINKLIDSSYYTPIAPPVYSQAGGQVFPGFQLTLSNPNIQGTIYYTTDGSDPRASGGGISATAQQYTTPFALPNSVTQVRARVFLNSDWSASCPVYFYTPQDYSSLVINEIHYHPKDTLAAEGDSFEFLEIKNNGSSTLDLTGTKFTKGIRFTFKNTTIQPDSFIVLARDSTAFLQKYGFKPDGDYEGKLSNGGERISYSNPFNQLIDSIKYNDAMNWDTLADGHGYSLELMNSGFDNALAVSWQHSQTRCGTPRAENSLACSIAASEVIINEINYTYTQPFLGIYAEDWVELYNNSPLPYDLSGWQIADSDSTYVIPTGTAIMPGEYLVFARDTTLFRKAHPDVEVIGPTNIGFSSNGEMIALLDQNGCPIDGLNYDTNGAWTSVANGSGATLSLLSPSIDNAEATSWATSGNYGGTPGTINSFNTCTISNSIIINEINYKSAPSPFPEDWIELHNPTTDNINISGWEFHDSQRFYTVPQGTVIPAGAYHVLVRSSDDFTSVFPSVTNYSGNFGFGVSSLGEIIGLFDEHRCIVDIVEYGSDAPWTTVPNANGPTLALLSPTHNNDLPGSWVPSTQGNAPNGTPGAPNNIPDPCINGLPEIIINEINYHSSTSGDSGDWLELYNSSAFTADLSGWTLQYQNTAYTFPTGTTIAAGDFLVVINNPTLFNNQFPAVANYMSVPALDLNDDEDRLLLYTDLLCLIDSVAYTNSNPWPTNADGYGASLALIDALSDNTNPMNWMALQDVQTPGSSNEIVCGPGGLFTGLHLWLKGGKGAGLAGIPANGDVIQNWTDQSPKENDAYQPLLSDSPTYHTDGINGHPVLRFDGVDDWYKINGVANELSGEATFFTVIEPATATDDIYYLSTNYYGDNRIKFGHSDDGELIYDDDVDPLSSANYVNKKTLVSANITPDIRVAGYINGVQATPWSEDMSSTGANRASIGQEFDGNGSDTETSNHWKGDMAEMIIYDKILTDNERYQVETYLSVKYGITIPVNNHLYYRHTNYPNNIAGIGMDLTQCLLQFQSTSMNAGAIVHIEGKMGLDQGDFLVWGNDGGSTATTTLQVPNTTLERLSRIWRVTETNDVGKVNVSFDVTGLGLNLSDASHFAILIDDNDSDFSDARTHFNGRNINGNTISFTDVTFNDDDLFTLAVKQQACPANDIIVPASVCNLTPNTFVPAIIIPDATYQWSFQQGNPATYTGTNAATYWNTAGTFTIGLTINYEHCIDFITKNINANICSSPPNAVNDFYSINEDDTLTSNVISNDSDPFNHELMLNTALIINPLNGNIMLNTSGDFSYTPHREFFGTDNFSYQICNNGTPSFCDTAEVFINIAYINDAPFALTDEYTIFNDDFATGNLLTNDFDIENHAFTPTANPIVFPQNGTAIVQNDGTFFYYPITGFVGVDSFTYKICDNGIPQACSEGKVRIHVQQRCADLQLHLWLEGAYDTTAGSMSTALNTARKILPGQSLSAQSGQPYSASPWNYTGTEGTGWTDADYAANVVDWVLVSFRTGIDKSTQVAIAAALLLADGTIQFTEDCPLPANYSALYVVVEHRNHIGVMSANPVAIVNNVLSYDFRVADSYHDTTSFGQKELTPGVWAMYGGDGSQTGDILSYDINGVDKGTWSLDNGVFGLYLPADYNMDGDINGADRGLWGTNNGITSRVPK